MALIINWAVEELAANLVCFRIKRATAGDLAFAIPRGIFVQSRLGLLRSYYLIIFEECFFRGLL